MRLSGWGRFPVRDCTVSAPRDAAALAERVAAGRAIARGNGRAYGDSALSEVNTVHMRRFDRMLAFDPESGLLAAEAGVLLGDVIRAFLPRGWFPPVTPGTKFVTLGGMIAADVHGKNHHVHGSFGNFVEWIEVMEPDGAVTRCSRQENAELFRWTVGGMGLTGVILRAAFRLTAVESGWIRQTTRPARDLDEAMALFKEAGAATYSVAWIDCLSRGASLGRSLLMLGEHATRAELPVSRAYRPFDTGRRRRLGLPFDLPGIALNGMTVRAFNALYYRNGRRKAGVAMVDWDSYFYPLDSILGWNRIYGRRGFLQFQCVLPLDASREGLTALLKAISAEGQGSFLAVLKRFGAQDSRFSFPMAGYTLALDFPRTPAVMRLLDRLDAITLDHGGRFYLAKDARLRPETLRRADSRADRFAEMRRQTGRAGAFASAQSERLEI